MSDCNKVKEEIECKKREQCLWNKSKKCQKKPSKKESLNMSSKTRSSISTIPDEVGEIGDACEEYEELLEKRKLLNEKIREKNRECENIKYSIIDSYFDENKKTHKDLLSALFNLYKTNNDRIYFQEFVRMFKRDTMTSLKFKRQHVFESLCRLLLLLNYDNEYGNDKKFYDSIEDFNIHTSTKLSRERILNTDINAGNSGGIVDIFFETNAEVLSQKNCKNDWACDCISSETIIDHKRTFILISCKYFDEEKSIDKKYDISTIFKKGEEKIRSENGDYKILLMINNAEELDKRLKRQKRKQEIIVFGVKQMEDWFYKLLLDFDRFEKIDDYFENKTQSCELKKIITPLFHQRFITLSTFDYMKEDYKLFIWGAVPRSGKSFIIGDFITNNQFRNENERENDIVLILGAKTETEEQFYKMFEDCSISSHFNIIRTSTKSHNYSKPKSIYILSQEWFKTKKIDFKDDTYTFTEQVRKKFPQLFENKRIDIMFDEVHKGGSTDRAQQILYAFYGEKIKIDVFVMVTATFAKPHIKYNTNFIDPQNKGIKIIEWSYENQQEMKSLTPSRKLKVVNSRKNENGFETIESKNMEIMFDEYERRYGRDNYLKIISDEYILHPELVIVQPDMNESIIDFRDIFIGNLNCDACNKDQSIGDLQNPSNIFVDRGRVDDLIRFIGNLNNDGSIDRNCVYHKLFNMGAPMSSYHSQLWFLPDKDLYLNDKDESCQKCRSIETELNEDDEIQSKKGLPNIEPLTRGLAFLIMENSYFQKRYNILIVHNTVLYLINNETKKGYSKLFEKNIQIIKKDQDLSTQIKQFEHFSFSNKKSLIILTGAKLRLGISLPCVDIAFNFDNISSIDNNYQTMFRVLTDRTYRPKKYGYYVDFNKDRSIQFLYDYNNTYGSGKNIVNIKEKTIYLQNLLHIFNYNGLGLIKQSALKEANQYIELIQKNKLDESSYQEYIVSPNGMTSLFSKSFIHLDYDLIHQMKNIIKFYHIDSKKIMKEKIKEGKKQKKQDGDKGEHEDDEDDEDDIPYDEDIVMDDNTFVQIFSSILQSIPALFAIFSNETDSLFECIKHCISDLEQKTNDLCSCENDSNIFACYMNQSTSFLKKSHMIQLLEGVLEISKNDSSKQVLINLNIIFNNIRDTMSKFKDALIFHMSPEEVQSKIEQYLPVRKEEKDRYGEVFTPILLIDEMMDKLPQSVWKNPELTWLDPANGIGNFPMIVYKRLMEKLPETYNNNGITYSSQIAKSRHILKNMIYMCEINPKNVKISKRIFGSHANICCCDFLKEETKWKTQFGRHSFDIIIGNPPFQDEIKNNVTKKNNSSHNTTQKKAPRSGGKNKLNERITISALSLLTPNGYLLFVTPDNIMSGNSGTAYKEIIQWHIVVINFNKIQKRYFPRIGQPMCYFLVHKNVENKETTIISHSQTFRIQLQDRAINPVREWTLETEKLIQKYVSEIRNNAIYNRGTKEEDYTGGKYKVIYTPDKIIRTDNKDLAQGVDIKKIVLFESKPYSSGILDMEGEYGVGPHTFYVPFTTMRDGKILANFFKSTEYNKLVFVTLTSQFLKTSLISHLNINNILQQPIIKLQTFIRKKQSIKKSKRGGDRCTKKQR